MKKRNVLYSMAIATIATFALTSCNKATPQVDQKAETTASATGLKIAYVEIDSIISQYKFCKDYSLVLQKKGQNIQNSLVKKQQQLQAAVANFQQKVQQNSYTRDQAESIQASLQRQDNDLRLLNQRLTNEFQLETEKYNNALRDSIKHFLSSYNKDKKYTLILSKAGDNILYADKAIDITKEVISGLNKAYKPLGKIKEEDKK